MQVINVMKRQHVNTKNWPIFPLQQKKSIFASLKHDSRKERRENCKNQGKKGTIMHPTGTTEVSNIHNVGVENSIKEVKCCF